jgi:DNA-binding NtrC family response regulator
MVIEVVTQRGIKFTNQVAKHKILLVDEEAQDLQSYCMLLESQGFEVSACNSIECGLDHLEREQFAFVLVGQGSKAFEGRKVLDRALQMDRHRAVLVVTRCVDMSCYLEAMQMGAVDYLEKPLALGDLLRFIKNHVRGQEVRVHGATA